ncbi:hypothetical protein Sango_1425100 [Sesamum angolense]|uniref:SWIM-type domain-containing protein n=1 Tax=Sesamum angolense TaxID=2727404 RepID=A0AAE1WU62_9LAMI|nr:hypothetical protein Sango_1425100 [Sesamum angolense]
MAIAVRIQYLNRQVIRVRNVDKVYTLTIHCRGKCKRLKNVDQDKYSYIDFLSDIREIHNVCDDGMLKISCSVDDSEVLMNITGDNDVLNMFSRNKNRTEFEVFEELCRVEKGVNEGEGSKEVEGSENEELSQTEGTESGESESWDEKKSGEKSDETGDELSNYISDDHCESKNESDSDFEDDPLQGSLNRDASVLADVAFAIAESECKESWEFFFENLSIMLSGFSYDKPWTFMRDRQKGLVETINEIVPNAVNRRCARHIYANFRGQFAGAALKRYFWQAARSYNVAGFNFALHKIKELKPVAYDWLLNIPAEMWSRHAFDERLKNDHVTNNISESFNHWVEDLRSKPMLTLVDGLRTKLMCRLQKRKLKGLKMSGDLVPNVVKELNKIKEESRKCHLLVAGEHEFEVQDQNINYIVNLRTRTCNCRVWGVFGIPCKHAALGIFHRRDSLESFCDSRFSKENYIKAYSYCIHPVPDPTFWPQDLEVEPTNLLPPIVRRMPGRPKKNRRNEPGEAPNCQEIKHGKDLELDVPLAQLASRKRKTEGSSSQFVAPTKTKKKTKAKSLSQPVPKPPISSSQPLPNTKHDPSMHVAGSTSQSPSNSGAAYLPPSFWRGLGVSPQREIRSKNNQDAKEVNPYEACKQQ